VLLMSVAAARRLGVPQDRWVFLHGHADLREPDLLDRADLSAGPASAMAVRHALAVAGIGADDLATIDLYSCFPAPVFNICDGLGLDPADPRGLTLTGGPSPRRCSGPVAPPAATAWSAPTAAS
jgi:acetyl-CoA C-acetyltransferase